MSVFNVRLFAQIIKLYLLNNERKVQINQNKEADCFMLT